MRTIAVDTGNRFIKTPHCEFNVGLVSHGDKPPAIQKATLKFAGNYYTLTEDRSPYIKDKTQDETYFLLTLIAIAQEMTATHRKDRDLILAVGLPPSHLPELRNKFAQYFLTKGRDVYFQYSGESYNIRINKVEVYPQGYAAVVDKLEQIKDFREAFIIDIGGYTTDVIKMSFAAPDMSFCESFDYGVIEMNLLIERAVAKAHSTINKLDDLYIESSLSGNASLPQEVRDTISAEAGAYSAQLIRKLNEKGINTTISLPIFIGGGSELFKPYLQKMCPNAIFVTDIHENAKGYKKMIDAKYPEAT